MRTTFFAGSLIFLALVAFPAFGQSAEETAAKAAEQAGKYQDALQQYTAALAKAKEGSADDLRLRETIIRIALKLSPIPTVPEDARRYMARGKAAVEIAKAPEDLRRAAAEIQKALIAAPWLADGYYNLAIVQEKAGDLTAAMRSYKLYLLAAPSAPDAQKVQTQIFGLEYKMERQKEEVAKAQKQAAGKRQEEERKKREELARRDPIRLAGDWYDGDPTQEGTRRHQVTVTGNNIEIRPTLMYIRAYSYHQYPSWVPYKSDVAPPVWRGTIEGSTITGTYYGDNSNWRGGQSYTRPMRGSVSPDGNTLRLQFKVVSVTSGRFPNPDGWREIDQELAFRR